MHGRATDADANGDGVRSECCKERKPDPDIFSMDHDHRLEGIRSNASGKVLLRRPAKVLLRVLADVNSATFAGSS